MSDKDVYASAIHCVALQYHNDTCMSESDLASIMRVLTRDWEYASSAKSEEGEE